MDDLRATHPANHEVPNGYGGPVLWNSTRPTEPVPAAAGVPASRRPVRRRTVALAATAILGVGALAGCGPTLPGSAATVGQDRITDSELAAITDPLQKELLGAAQPAQVNQAVLNRLIVANLIDDLSGQQGIAVTQGDIDSYIDQARIGLGGQEALDQQLLQSAILPSEIDTVVRTSLQAQRLGEKLGGATDPQIQQQKFSEALVAYTQTQDVRVSPRFGTWDATTLTIGPVPNTLSSPPTQPSAPLEAPTTP